MFGIKDLKGQIEITETTVECPVKGCSEKVERQRGYFRRDDRFKCLEHEIYISPSTFEYPGEGHNILWKDESDRELLKRIKKVKRESRMARDNSEDAVSWNVFRFMEKNKIIEPFLSEFTGTPLNSPEIIYWSYSQQESAGWSLLNKAREEFGETIAKGSEPDIIVKTDKALFFIEAKVTAGNKTSPSNGNNVKKYLSGGNYWYSKVFISDYGKLAIEKKKYELLRFWLLGSWMAKQEGLAFYLINLVLSQRELDIEHIFRPHIRENASRKYMRYTWEEIYRYILRQGSTADNGTMVEFFRNKAAGYSQGVLQKAFLI